MLLEAHICDLRAFSIKQYNYARLLIKGSIYKHVIAGGYLILFMCNCSC